MSAHTPGPWEWRGKPGKSELHSAHGQVLGYAHYEGMWLGDYRADVDASNARLIAAAPELLDALYGMVRERESEGWPIKAEHLAILAQARAAIAKATGVEP